MISRYARVYRDILRELSRAVSAFCSFHKICLWTRTKAVVPRKMNHVMASNYRSIVEKSRTSGDSTMFQDLENALLFLRSQREHKVSHRPIQNFVSSNQRPFHQLLIDRYNPLIDLTAEERIYATARRVGLDMPVTHKAENLE